MAANMIAYPDVRDRFRWITETSWNDPQFRTLFNIYLDEEKKLNEYRLIAEHQQEYIKQLEQEKIELHKKLRAVQFSPVDSEYRVNLMS